MTYISVIKKRGAQYKPLTEYQIEIVEEYLTSDKGYRELADEKGVNIGALRYWHKKYNDVKAKEKEVCM